VNGIIGGLATLFVVWSESQTFGSVLMQWLPGAVLAGGVAARVTYSTRQVTFGVLAGLLSAFGFYVVTLPLLSKYPFLWPLLPYLPTFSTAPLFFDAMSLTEADYTLNRTVVLALGGALLCSSFYALRNTERLLLGSLSRKGTS